VPSHQKLAKVAVWLQVVLTLALDGGESSEITPQPLNPQKKKIWHIDWTGNG
jgi:hypothetical protein